MGCASKRSWHLLELWSDQDKLRGANKGCDKKPYASSKKACKICMIAIEKANIHRCCEQIYSCHTLQPFHTCQRMSLVYIMYGCAHWVPWSQEAFYKNIICMTTTQWMSMVESHLGYIILYNLNQILETSTRHGLWASHRVADQHDIPNTSTIVNGSRMGSNVGREVMAQRDNHICNPPH